MKCSTWIGSRPQKINNCLYLFKNFFFRYMEVNKAVTREKRLEEYKLKEQLAALEQELEK